MILWRKTGYRLGDKVIKKSIQKNYIFNMIYQILTIIVPFVTTPYLSRVLGVSGIGLISYTNSIISYFTLFENLGTATYAQREIGYHQNDCENRTRIFWEILCIRFVMFILTTFVYAWYCVSLKGDKTIYVILAMNLFNALLDVTWFFQGMENFQIVVLRNVIFKIVNVCVIFLFVNKPEDLYIYVLSTALLSTFCSITTWIYLRKYLCRISVRNLKPWRHLKGTIQLFLPTIAIQIYTVLDKSMIGIITGSTVENGYYEQADKVMKICLTFVVSLGTVMIPRIANTYAQRNEELIKYYIYRSYRFVWLVSIPMFLGIAAVSDFFVPIFFGKGYDQVIVLLPIVSILLIIIGLSNVTGQQYFVPTQQQDKLTKSVVVGAVVNLIVNALLIPRFASTGAALGSIIAECSVTFTQFIYLKREKKIQITRIFLEMWRYVVAGCAMFVVLLILKRYMSVEVCNLSVLVTLGGIIYCSILWLLRDEMLFSFISNIVKKIKRKNGEMLYKE